MFRPDRTRSGRVDCGVAVITACAALLVCGSLCWILWDLVQGFSVLSWDFFVSEPLDAGRSGGIGSLLVSTAWILAICLACTIPIGLATAVTLSEYLPRNSRVRQSLRRSLDVLNSVPSIVFGLFGYAVFAKALGLGFSILSGGLTLACMALPLFIRISEQSMLLAPAQYRQAAQALALSQSGWILRILLPVAAPGIAAGLILAIGRALAESAALIFTSGYVMRMPDSVFDSGRALAVHIYDLSMNVPGGNRQAAATGLVLIGALLVINMVTSALMRRWQGV